MVVLNVIYEMKEGGAQAFVKGLEDAGIVQQIRAHEGCLKYDYYLPMDGKSELLLIERWADQAALDAHQACAYMPELRRIKDLYATKTNVNKYVTE